MSIGPPKGWFKTGTPARHGPGRWDAPDLALLGHGVLGIRRRYRVNAPSS